MSEFSSRQTSPVVGSRAQSPRVNTKRQKSKSFFVISLIVVILFSFVEIIYYAHDVKPLFCTENGLNQFCTKCPENGKCTILKLECDEGYTKIDKYCMKGNLTNEQKNEFRKEANNAIKNFMKIESNLSFVLENPKELMEYLSYNGYFISEDDGCKWISRKPPVFYISITISMIILFIKT